jgi:hypothetical protein
MNIFYLQREPEACAHDHCDKHVPKMILEYAQLMSTAHRELDGDDCVDQLYKSTHKNHPSAIWARSSDKHYMWLYELFCALSEEYQTRYGKEHLTFTKLHGILQYLPHNIRANGFTDPPQCMPDMYKHDDCITAYRSFYRHDKSRFAKWQYSDVPTWYTTSHV